MSREPVATWICTNIHCRQKDIPKYSYSEQYTNVMCGACGEPCSMLEAATLPVLPQEEPG